MPDLIKLKNIKGKEFKVDENGVISASGGLLGNVEGNLSALGVLALDLGASAASVTVEADSAATDTLTLTFPVSVGADGNTVSVNLTTAADDNLAVSESAEVITIALANTTATKNTAALIETAVQALGTTTAGVDVSGITATAGGDWDTAAIATGETGAVAFTGGADSSETTLTSSQEENNILIVSGAESAENILATPTAGKLYVLQNDSGQAITLKADGETGVAVANDKTAILLGNGTDFVRVTADA